MVVHGKWHDQGSAAHCDATLHFVHDYFTISTATGMSFSGLAEDLEVSDRLGNVERRLTLANGSIFTTKDNDAIDQLFKSRKRASDFVHILESRVSIAILALFATIFACYGAFKWGIPWASSKIADALPQTTNELISEHTLSFLDKYVLDETRLEAEKTEQIRNHFDTVLVPLDTENNDKNYTLHFRDWSVGDESVPNAFALPSGDIILTDRFVELAENQNEIDAVLLHEMGHVIHNHGLKRVVQGTIISVIVMVAFGDAGGMSDLGLGLGSALINSSYSRDDESEADLYAFRLMLHAKIDPKAFSDIMSRMTDDVKREKKSADPNSKEENEDNTQDVLDYLSSHPNTAKRIAKAMQYSECFQQKLITCNIDTD